jgi:hypothetical protein
MRYMMLVYKDEKAWDAMSLQERGEVFRQAAEYGEGLRKAGVVQAGDPLEPTATAATLRMKNGKPVVTDGPFAETKEQLGGYMIVEARDVDEAISIAAANPLLRAGLSIEVRPIRVGPPR